MLLDMWWLYIVGGVVLAFVIFQAWDRRHSCELFSRQEKGRVDSQSARYAKGVETSRQSHSSPQPSGSSLTAEVGDGDR
jgi:FtsZ-interacting cell division protein ZipA